MKNKLLNIHQRYKSYQDSWRHEEQLRKFYALSSIGIVLAIFAYACSSAALERSQRVLFEIPLAAIGIAGYLAIAITSMLQRKKVLFFYLRNILVTGAFCFTFFLIWKAVKLIHPCPFCIGNWTINFILFKLMISEYLQAKARRDCCY